MPVISSIPNQITGFDTQGAVKQLLAVDQFKINQLKQKQTDQTAKQVALTQLNTALSTLRSTSTAMASASQFFSFTASLSSSASGVTAGSLLNVSGTNAVSAGSHTLVVNQIAAAERLSSSSAVISASTGSAAASDAEALGLTAASFQINGVTINVTAADSIQDISFAINQANTGSTATGVTASVIKAGTNDFRLVLVSDNTGSTGFTLSGNALNTGGSLANLKLGSLASNAAITSDTTQMNLTGAFNINGTAVNVVATDTLQGIATTINGLGIGVKASVESFGASDFRLSLQGDALAGTPAKTITLTTGSGGVLSGLGLSAGSQTALALSADAKLTIDGLQVTRASNKISDALAGVTFDLKQADPATLSLNVGVDTTALRANVQSFVDAYNGVQSFINDQFVFDKKTGKNGVLSGESLITSIQSSLSSSLLTSVPGIAAGKPDSLVRIGVEPDRNGVLSINDNIFSGFLNTDVNAIRDVFAVQGSSINNDLKFLVNGLNTPSGTYSVGITQAGTQAIKTGAAIPSPGGLGGAETIAITAVNDPVAASVVLGAGDSQATILNKLNTEFGKIITEQHLFGTPLTDSATSLPATSGALLTNLGVGLAVSDTITLAGTDRSGVAVSGSLVVAATDTLNDLFLAIQSTFGQQVTASVDVSGKIQVTDTQAGASGLTVALQKNAADLFGVDTATEGRYALDLEAVASGTSVQIQSKSFGLSAGFSIAQTAGTSDFLGLVTPIINGVDVAGTVTLTGAGNPALTTTGKGQVLTVASGTNSNVDGLALLFTGAAPVTSDLVLGVGAAARFDGSLDLFTNPATGLIQNSITSSLGINTTLDQQIANLQDQMDRKRVQLTASFAKLTQSLASLKATGNFLTNQINAFSAKN
ncbi:MAG: flagellar filament capping protein FliD [Mariprofundaceae bacterium]|nr:flagellar filament capping protein FliD [Mariprofundaceae bacterium]